MGCLLALAPVAPARAQAVDETTQRILVLESLGRARPIETAAELEQLRTATAELSPQRLELLTVQGPMLAVASQPEAAERSAAQLDAWRGRPGAALAAEAAASLLQQAMKDLPATLSARDCWRFVAALGYIKNEAGKLEDAVRLATEAADGVSLARTHNTRAIVLEGLGDLPGERRSFELAIDHARRAGAKFHEVQYLANLADFFLKNAEYKTALAQAERALPLARELKDSVSETVALANIGLAHISLQHLDLGQRYVREAIAIDERRGSIGGVSDLLRELGVYLEKAGDAAGAVDAYHRHRRLDAGILRDDQQKAILSMQEQYDADGRTRALALLNRENDIKAELLRRRDL